ncbi:toxin-antitoxin sytem YoeB family toxin component (plasmid) [Cyanobacterium sp. HL-69]|uniref:Txe/YoeB family addiction module toxin n=1 Tax=unclassified Cyanobacterium TaxID=2629879 RepID=UPI0008526D36|nr:toxin-antitoxin sytem YoeB family toxin component [Cyanobacterium sp. HL-69]OEJ80028.1 addiction module toxin YoeB [Cyanobacterium sp. IPPAS B-1200]
MKGRKKNNRKEQQKATKSESIEVKSLFPVFHPRFREDLAWWYRTDKTKANKILDLIEAIMKSPFEGIGKPEPLKFLDSNTWSRRIDLEHRLVYRVTEERIDFLQARYHYEKY